MKTSSSSNFYRFNFDKSLQPGSKSSKKFG